MSNIKPTQPIDINKVLEDVELFKYHPLGLVNYSLNLLSDMNDGRVDIIEPNNPLAYNIEVAALMTHYAVQEHTLLSRKMYPVLANTEEDLHLHMSDKDYLGRFSSPAFTNVTFNISYNDFLAKAGYDPLTKDRVLVLPRNYQVEIEETIYSLTSPVKIRMTESGVIDVRHDNNLTDPIFPLSTDFIPFDIVSYFQNETYINFNVRMPEVDIEVKTFPIIKGKLVKGTLNFKQGRLFYYVKAFCLDQTGSMWVPMTTTHTEDVWDVNDPTCIVRVHANSNELEYYIPPTYINNDMVGSQVRLLVYTTKGPINIDYADFLIQDFKMKYNKVFPEVENTEYTRPINTISMTAFIREKVIDGKGQKSFSELKKDVINNNLRPNLPITINQIENYLNRTGLTLVKNHDVVTNREFLFKTSIPSNVTRYKIARMALDLMEFKTSVVELASGKNSVIEVKPNIFVIPHNTLFEVDRDLGVRILDKEEAKTLKALSGQTLVKEVNRRNYMSTYYHYIFDSSGEFTDLRAYDVERPTIPNVNFKDYNDTTMIGVNTAAADVLKTDTGYRINVLVDVKIFNELYDINNVTPIMVYIDGNDTRFYLEGKLYSDTAQGKVFSFYIDSDCYIDEKDHIHVENFKDANGYEIGINFPIEAKLDVLFCSNKVPLTYNSKDMDDIISRSYLNGKYSVITRETYTIIFAERMKYLYSRVHTSTGLDLYKYHEEDVYLKYDKVIFNEKNEIIHRPGDFVLDKDGKKVIQWKKGEIVLGDDGKPVKVGQEDLAKYLNVLLVDYKFVLSTDYLTEQYKDHVRLHLRSLLLNNMVRLQEELLEATTAYLTVPNGLTDVIVQYDGKFGYIQPNQSFKFDVFVNSRVYGDDVTRKGIEETVKEVLDQYITGNKELSKTILVEEVLSKVKEFVKTISLQNLTELNAEYIKILDDKAEIAIKKRLVVTADGFKVEDDITFNFINTDVRRK